MADAVSAFDVGGEVERGRFVGLRFEEDKNRNLISTAYSNFARTVPSFWYCFYAALTFIFIGYCVAECHSDYKEGEDRTQSDLIDAFIALFVWIPAIVPIGQRFVCWGRTNAVLLARC